MTDKEFEGKDLDEALAAASSALGISEDELHYEMLEQGRRGLLGLGTRNVRIRVKPSLSSEIPLDDEEIPLAPPAADEDKSSQPKRRRSRNRRRGGAGRKRATSGDTDRPTPQRVESDKPMVDEAVVQKVTATLTQMVELMDLELAIEGRAERGCVAISLEGGDQLQLSDNNSELILAMQFLLNRMARRSWPDAGRIKLFTAGETEEPRDDELVALTREIADQVAETGNTLKMKPMNAYERRLVHLTVREYAGLSSNSDGRGAMKRVRISKIQNQI